MNPALSATLLVLFIAGLLLVLVNFGGCVDLGNVEMPDMKKPLEEVLKEATPTPWVAASDEFSTRVTSDLCLVADCSSHAGPLQGEVEANAALLAHFRNVGPELVEALEKLTTDIELAYLNEKWSEVLFAKDRVLDLLSRAKEVEVP